MIYRNEEKDGSSEFCLSLKRYGELGRDEQLPGFPTSYVVGFIVCVQ